MTDLSKTGHTGAPGGEAGSGNPLPWARRVADRVHGRRRGGTTRPCGRRGAARLRRERQPGDAAVLRAVHRAAADLRGRLHADGRTGTRRGGLLRLRPGGAGPDPGLSAATLALFSYTLLLVGVDAYVGVATSNVIERYADVGSPWWAWALISLGVIAFLGHRDIELSAKVLGAVLVLEFLLLLVMDVGIVGHGGAHGLTAEPVSPSIVGTGSLGLGVMFAFFGFTGFEATAVFRHEAKDPDVTVPRATYVAILVIGAFYSFTVWAIVVGSGVGAVVGAAQADPEGLVLTLTRSYVGSVWADAMQLLLITSQFACVLAFHNVVTRYQFALSRAGALPASLSVAHPRHRAPSASSAVAPAVAFVTTLVVASLGLDPIGDLYAWFSGAATPGIVLLMAATSLAVVGFFRRATGGSRCGGRSWPRPSPSSAWPAWSA
ncbi:amino acid permease [Streptomyces sp. SID335]|nr:MULTISPECIES: APC family permease [unclassified Streptomyces]NEA00443.1 APC family permease [Streptomyces sp. SID10116]MYY86224.1 amino acid permease [Streptomyces sp. SID335]MYZ19408.1 amino acid permease [Streptomyces sp. SID337]NDZ87877.1 APC family permease [Streptomyces sp. SID10115]NEB42819.1 APC family permease [Streptomyces sp. SID339]